MKRNTYLSRAFKSATALFEREKAQILVSKAQQDNFVRKLRAAINAPTEKISP